MRSVPLLLALILPAPEAHPDASPGPRGALVKIHVGGRVAATNAAHPPEPPTISPERASTSAVPDTAP